MATSSSVPAQIAYMEPQMTSATSAQSANNFRATRQGFTLIELLVVIGIIVVLASLLIPMVMRARHAALRNSIGAQLNTIATALDAYKADWGDYPRPQI